jgi:hypothetical protein
MTRVRVAGLEAAGLAARAPGLVLDFGEGHYFTG